MQPFGKRNPPPQKISDELNKVGLIRLEVFIVVFFGQGPEFVESPGNVSGPTSHF